MHAITPPQVEDAALADHHKNPLHPTLEPVQVSLNGNTAFWCVGYSSQLCITSKLAEAGLYPFVQVTDEDAEQDLTQHWPLRNLTNYRPPTSLYTTDPNPPISAIHPALNPPHCPLVCPIPPT